ncbi:hypothetical protein GCM10023091_18180 [Ravibacter arvi]|uniref:Alpha glucuronidase N-terminal domain-containing protein n=1 Tax=Ravibacter arvi TaxID=2051041 RepID=A0ABP8LVK6_9BACT
MKVSYQSGPFCSPGLFLFCIRFSILLVLAQLQWSCRSETYLVQDGTSNYRIFIAEDAPEPEKQAAHELQQHLLKVSGALLPVTHEPHPQTIYVGFRGAPASLTAGLSPESFPNERYVLRSDGTSLLIAGGGSRGTMYGVIGYLADHIGCRWYTRDVHKIPNLTTIALNEFDEQQQPAFEYREAWYQEAYDTRWALFNRLNPSIVPIPDSLGGSYITYPFAHTFYSLVPPEKHFSSHSEYFAMVNGKRQREHAQLCLTNRAMRKEAVQTVFGWIKERPEVNVFSVDQNDGYGFCECPDCKAIDEREGGPSGSLIDFVNYVSDTVGKVYPDLKIQTFAYAYTEAPPKHLKPNPNVTIRLCRYGYCSAHGIDQCEHSKPFRERYEAWKKIARRISVWDYFTDFAQYLMPYPNFASVTRNVKWYAEKGAVGLFAQGNNVPKNGGGEFSALRSWVFAQLMWNPNQNGDALIREFVTNVYGDAAPYVQRYIDMMHADVQADSAHFSIWAQPIELNYLRPEMINKADSLFRLALNAASGDSALQERIKLAALPIDYTQLYFYAIGGNAYLKPERMPAVLARFESVIKKHGISAMGDIPETYGNIGAFLQRVRTTPAFVSDWQVTGPFDNTDKKGLARVFAPETSAMSAEQLFKDKTGSSVKWQPYSGQTSAYVDFTKLFSNPDFSVAYAYHNYRSSESRKATFGVGSNDGVRVWINGRLMLDRPVSRKAEPNQDVFTVTLNGGDNHILVKVDQLERGWGFYFGEMK